MIGLHRMKKGKATLVIISRIEGKGSHNHGRRVTERNLVFKITFKRIKVRKIIPPIFL